ncbi:MAG: ribonuclease III [Prochloraceae cyanobacterium]
MIEDPQRSRKLKQLIRKLGLDDRSPINWSLLDLALTHPSASRDANYQQLEFVGDAVVRLFASEILLETYPQASVGEFAAIRSILVSDRVLAELGDLYSLELYLSVSYSASADLAGRTSRLADAFEALLGALYLSTQTMSLVRPWLKLPLKERAAQILQDPALQNYKDALQEWTQGQYKILPEYRVREDKNGTLDRERFLAEVWLQNRCLGKGKGRSKKAAEQAAAKVAFLSVNDR